ncbi:DNA gyrase subunit A [Ostreibacterium oceani]|uniref:DNA gyrase subunit A n=1 Tax=Ostreibacterium oceani TaxID=2654998 RepID=A0A6N7EUG7_9GAMM|nr:DNA gyrase subunit A [Ostreibacterium oceani]MPV86082.1 DNA gyrase subunit A [Ostreibacterium oceani]
MTEFAKQVAPVSLEGEMKASYLDYAMSVIVGRALPDVRDGLKPVHRRVLYAMDKNNNAFNRPYIKSARIVGEVIGKYHPHGDQAVYDTIVRMAQPFSMRNMLVDGQGNFGSIDGDAAAAMRYTEIRMAKITHRLLADINKETVDFVPNYDGKEFEPTVLPTLVPNLLVNGASGIAVGMATNIPPHNVGEVVNACLVELDNENATVDDFLAVMPGPDFPTAAILNGSEGIRQAYETGKGRLFVRSKTHVETINEVNGRQAIVIDELPYQVNKARLVERVAQLMKEKIITGIYDLRDESDKQGIRVVIELNLGEVPEVILNNLFRQTQLQVTFGVNMVALHDGRPQLLPLKTIIRAFLKHRREVVTRRTIFDLRKAKNRAHVLEGLTVALHNIDEVIAMIKQSPGPAEAKEALVSKAWRPGQVLDMLARAGAENSHPDELPDTYGLQQDAYHLSPVQAQAILDMRLHRLTGLEQEKIIEEYKTLIELIEDLLDILTNPDRLIQVIREELIAIRDEFADVRRTQIIDQHINLTLEDLIAEESLVVTWSHDGYVKSQPLADYEAQRRGGRGKSATKTKDEDFVERLFVANSHDTLLSFTSYGKVFWIKVYDLPQAGRNAKGKPIVNLLQLDSDEKVQAVLPVREYRDDAFIFFATRNGVVKKTPLSAFSNQRANGIIALSLRDGDELLDVGVTNGQCDVMLFSDTGKVIRFNENDVRSMGRTAAGVRGMRLVDNSRIVDLVVVNPADDVDILTATIRGYGKRTALAEYPLRGRGGQGVISIQTSERNGAVVGAIQVTDSEEVMLITNGGTLIRTRAAEVSRVGRNTQGVKLIRMGEGESLISVVRIIDDEEAAEDAAELAVDGASAGIGVSGSAIDSAIDVSVDSAFDEDAGNIDADIDDDADNDADDAADESRD